MTHEAMLIDRWRNGDMGAIDTLIKENMPVVQRLALKLTKDPDQAEDIVSEALIRAYRSAAKFQGGAQFKTWLHRIVLNCVLDARRKHNFQTSSLDEMRSEDDGSWVQMQLADDSPSPLDLMLELDQFDRIEKSIEALVDDQRNLVYLFHKGNLGYQGIAEAVNSPVGTVKSRLHRARQSMKEQIERDDRDANYRFKFDFEHRKAS